MPVNPSSRSREVNKFTANELAKGQKPFTTKVPDKGSKGDLAHLQETMDKQEKMLWSTILTLAKNQVIDSDKGGLDSASIMQATSTSAQFKMQKMGLEQSMKAFDMMKEAALSTTSQMVGKNVSLDDGMRHFSGSPVKFNYEILSKNIPPNAMVQTQISIMTDEGKEVFSKSSRGDKSGNNSFLWIGTDQKGEKVEEGTYRISVSASYTIPGTNDKPVNLAITTVKQGTIDSIEVDDERNISLIIDGQRFSMDALRGMSHNKNQDIEDTSGPISTYMGYVGKTVEIEQAKITFNNAPVNVPFISTANAKDVTVAIQFFGEDGKLAGYSEQIQNIQKGQNSFLWHGWDIKSATQLNDIKDKKTPLSYLPAGVYTYKVSVISEDNKGSKTTTELKNSGIYQIDSVDKSTGTVVLGSGSNKFDIKDIKRIVETSPAKSSHSQLLNEGANLIGKKAVFDTFITYDGNTNAEINFLIKNPGDGKHLGAAKIKISNEQGEQIAVITIPSNQLYVDDIVKEEDVPTTIDQLNEPSKQIVKDFFAKQFPDADWENQLQSQKNIVKQFIHNNFRGGKLFLDGYDALTPEDQDTQKLKNIGVIHVEWDGKTTGNNPAKVQPGNYQYVIDCEILDTDNTIVAMENISKQDGKIIGSKTDNNGEIILYIEGDLEIPLNKITQLSI